MMSPMDFDHSDFLSSLCSIVEHLLQRSGVFGRKLARGIPSLEEFQFSATNLSITPQKSKTGFRVCSVVRFRRC